MKYARGAEGKHVCAAGRPPVAAVAPRRQRSLQATVRQLLHADGCVSCEADLAHALTQMSDAFFEGLALFTGDGRIAYLNEASCRLLGRRREELLGRPAAQFFGAFNSQALVCDEEAGRSRYEMGVSTPGGKKVVVQVAVQRIATSAGSNMGSFAVLMDITARAEAEAALRRSESELRLLSAQLLGAQELERQRIARELHDGIGQALGGLKCGLNLCEVLLDKGATQEATRKLRELGERVRATIEEVRRIAMDLRPSTLDDLGVLATLGWLAREFRGVYTHIELETNVEACEEEIAAPAKTALYRIVQEALNNVVTHARARRVTMSVRRDAGRIALVLRDDGAGFDPASYAAVDPSGKGLGLASMRERAEGSGGRFHLHSEPGYGTEVRVLWPSTRREESHAA